MAKQYTYRQPGYNPIEDYSPPRKQALMPFITCGVLMMVMLLGCGMSVGAFAASQVRNNANPGIHQGVGSSEESTAEATEEETQEATEETTAEVTPEATEETTAEPTLTVTNIVTPSPTPTATFSIFKEATRLPSIMDLVQRATAIPTAFPTAIPSALPRIEYVRVTSIPEVIEVLVTSVPIVIVETQIQIQPVIVTATITPSPTPTMTATLVPQWNVSARCDTYPQFVITNFGGGLTDWVQLAIKDPVGNIVLAPTAQPDELAPMMSYTLTAPWIEGTITLVIYQFWDQLTPEFYYSVDCIPTPTPTMTATPTETASPTPTETATELMPETTVSP